jgi:hypothetical protein
MSVEVRLVGKEPGWWGVNVLVMTCGALRLVGVVLWIVGEEKDGEGEKKGVDRED